MPNKRIRVRFFPDNDIPGNKIKGRMFMEDNKVLGVITEEERKGFVEIKEDGDMGSHL